MAVALCVSSTGPFNTLSAFLFLPEKLLKIIAIQLYTGDYRTSVPSAHGRGGETQLVSSRQRLLLLTATTDFKRSHGLPAVGHAMFIRYMERHGNRRRSEKRRA